MNKSKFAWSCYFLFLSFWALAQQVNIQYYNSADGLSGSSTQFLVQDGQGLIWVLSEGKLHRFDGQRFEQFNPPVDLPGNSEHLHDIIYQHDSSLVIISDHYLLSFNPLSGSWKTLPIPSRKKGNQRMYFVKDFKNNQKVLVYYPEKLDSLHIIRFHPKYAKTVYPVGNFPVQEFIRFIGLDGRLYFQKQEIFAGEFSIYDLAEQKITNILLGENRSQNHPMDIYPIARDKLAILSRSKSNIVKLDVLQDLEQLSPHPANRFLKKTSIIGNINILSDEVGNLWLYGTNRSLLFYHAKRDTLFDYTLEVQKAVPSINNIHNASIDNTGVLWLTSQLGLLKVSRQEAGFERLLSESIDICFGYCSFRGITEDSDGQIIASFYPNIVQFDPNRKSSYSILKSPALPSGLHANQQGLWLNNGQLMNTETGSIRNIPGAKDLLGIEEGLFAADPSGKVWWVYQYELFLLQEDSDQVHWQKILELPKNDHFVTNTIHVGNTSGNVYIGHDGRLLQYSPRTEQQNWIDLNDWEVQNTRILAINEFPNEIIWIATDVGLVRLNTSEQEVKHYTTKDGLPNDFVCGLLTEGDSCLWLSTNHGLSRFHIKNESFVNFFEEDGLTYNEFNRKSYFKARDGKLYFGGLRGLNAFYPEVIMDKLRNQNKAAKIGLVSFEFTDEQKDTTFRQLSFTQHPVIDLYHQHRSFTFEYLLTDFRNPEEVQYSYVMEGYENTWSTPSKFNFTRFSSLPSGKYMFRVKAKDSHGQWLSNQLAATIIVHPPWWATWWAYLAYSLVFISIAYAIFSFLKKRWQLQNKLKLEQSEALRLKELDSFKTKLYTNLTHEFRTPLTVILGMTDQISKQPDKYLEKGTKLIKTNGQNLLHLINQLLDLSKLEDKSFKLHMERGDFVAYLRYITESFQTFANSQNVLLRFFSTLENLDMDFDPEQIKQVMTNLISNAIKFTPSGGEVAVRLTTEDKTVVFTVSDTGIGIAQQDLPHIFDRFYQVDGSTTREGEGTGIGLAHTLELVKLMEGKIEVESELGKGSRFIVQLPIHTNAAVKTQLEKEMNSDLELLPVLENNTEALVSVSNSNLSEAPRLLIIEDNPDVVVYLKSCLEDLYQLDIAFNGRIGIEKALEHIPDLIISDVMMPEKDGLKVCDTLKNDERTSHIPIVLLTAKADIASKIAGLRRGADAYLAKPFDKEELVVRLEKLIERQQRVIAFFNQRFETKESIPILKEDPVQEAIQVEDIFIQKVRNIIAENHTKEDFSLPQLCQKIGMSRSQLYRKMKALIDSSPSDFIRNYRLDQAKTLLETTDMNVSEVAWEVGFKDLTHFSRAFQSKFGFLPSATNK